MGQFNLLGFIGRRRARTAKRRRLEAERLAGPHPRAGHWYVVGGLGHLYLNPARDEPDGPASPVCDVAPIDGAPKMNVNAGDPVCPNCDAYLYEVCLPAWC